MPHRKSKRRKPSGPRAADPRAAGNNLAWGGAILVALALVAGLAWLISTPTTTIVQVRVPALSEKAQAGAVLFKEHCVECHGANAGGSDKGPPLIHDYYKPAHHADAAIFRAIAQGVHAHHWQFGDMPPRPEIKRGQTALVVAYIRELQRANGIE